MIYADYKRLLSLQQQFPDEMPSINIDKLNIGNGPKHTLVLTPSLFITSLGMILGALSLIAYAGICVSIYFHAEDNNGRVIAANIFFIGLCLSWLLSRMPFKVQFSLIALSTLALLGVYFTPTFTIPHVLYEHVAMFYLVYVLGLAFSEFHIYRKKKSIWNKHTEGKQSFSDSLARIVPLIDRYPAGEVVRKYHAENTTNAIIRDLHHKQEFFSFSARSSSAEAHYVDEVLLAGKNLVLVFSIFPDEGDLAEGLNTPPLLWLQETVHYYQSTFPKHYVSAFCIVYNVDKKAPLPEHMKDTDTISYIKPQEFSRVEDTLFFSYAKYVATDRNSVIRLLSFSDSDHPLRTAEEQDYFTRRY